MQSISIFTNFLIVLCSASVAERFSFNNTYANLKADFDNTQSSIFRNNSFIFSFDMLMREPNIHFTSKALYNVTKWSTYLV